MVAVLGIAGFMNASSPSDTQANQNSVRKNFTSEQTFFRGTCTIQVYRDNHDGSNTLVYSNTVQTDTSQPCNDLRDQILEQAENENW